MLCIIHDGHWKENIYLKNMWLDVSYWQRNITSNFSLAIWYLDYNIGMTNRLLLSIQTIIDKKFNLTIYKYSINAAQLNKYILKKFNNICKRWMQIFTQLEAKLKLFFWASHGINLSMKFCKIRDLENYFIFGLAKAFPDLLKICPCIPTKHWR